MYACAHTVTLPSGEVTGAPVQSSELFSEEDDEAHCSWIGSLARLTTELECVGTLTPTLHFAPMAQVTLCRIKFLSALHNSHVR